MAKQRRPIRTVEKNRFGSNPDPGHAAELCPTKIRCQFALYDFIRAGYRSWRGASFFAVAATPEEALDLFATLEKAAADWWKARS